MSTTPGTALQRTPLPIPVEQARQRRIGLLGPLLVVLCLAGIGLRWAFLGSGSLGYDEGFTWWVAGQTPLRIIRIIQQDTWPPLYYLIMHVWIGLFGDTEFAMRAQSALASTLTMGVGLLLAWRIFPQRWPRLVAAGLLAISAMQIEFAQTVRCYATASLLVLCTLLAISRRVEGGRRYWNIAYIASAAALVYQHNIMWFYLACLHVTWLLWPGKQGTARRLWEMVACDLTVALTFAPWLPSLLSQLGNIDKAFWTQRPAFYDLTFVLSSVSGVTLDTLSAAANALGFHDPSDRLIRLPVFALIVLLLGNAIISTPSATRRRMLALLICAAGPIVLAFLYSRYRQSIFINRVFTPTSALMPLLFAGIAIGGVRGWRWFARIALVTISLLAFASAMLVFAKPTPEPWRQVMTYLHQQQRPGDQVLFFACEGELMSDYYTKRMGWERLPTGGVPVDFLSNDPPRVQLHVNSDSDLAPLKARVQNPQTTRVVLVEAHVGWLDRLSRVESYFNQNWRPEEVSHWSLITLSTFSRKAEAPNPGAFAADANRVH